ncbi:glycosyl transferase [Paramagnetospirillum marisnigri]|uniref:Glycosyl transferase n=1 Tax=Paramagnetospirillum marisnigri TaxID=1285242 RepID=A0A178MSM4_9PROT|nr:glycosyl transferase [Paramagnetospirillum marisnigri]
MSRPILILVLLVAGLTLVRMGVAGSALLSGDEAYYWLWSRRLQLSYFDHPGMVAWWMAASTWVFGESELAVRLPAILASALVTGLVFDTARVAFGDVRAGLWAAAWLNATVLFGAAAVTVTPDPPLLAAWTTALWAMTRLMRQGRAVWIYVLGAALGLGFASKYTMVLIAPGILAVFLLFPEGRRWWRSPHFYLAIALAVACTAPVLVWNLTNDWVSFRKQLSHSFDTPVSSPLKSLGTFVGTQLGVVTPLVLGFALWGMGWALWAGWRRGRADWFLLGASSAPVLAFFLNHSLGGLVQPHWAGPAYLGGVMAAVGGWRSWPLGEGPRGRLGESLFKAAPLLGAVLLAVVYLQMATALLPVPPKSDPLGRLGGWDRVAEAVEEQRRLHPDAFVFVQKHEMSGLLTYYLPGHPKAYLTGSAGIPRIPSYDAGDVAGLRGRDALFVTRVSPRGVEDAAKFFDRISLVGALDRSWGGRVIDRYEIWLAEGYRQGMFEEFAEDKARGVQ